MSAPSTMESLTAQARAEGMLDRLGAERQIARRITRADGEKRSYRRLMLKAIDEQREADAYRWGALLESAATRGDRLARALHGIVADRERRADLERQERVVEAARRPSTRAVA